MKPLRILVVDDDEVLRDQLMAVLLALGHDCSAAGDGSEALAMHRHKRFEVVLSDWLMPEMDGLELCRRMRREDLREGYAYFIFMTGVVDRSSAADALREGADEYLTKPVDVEQLQACLLPAARITALQRSLLRKNASLRRDSERSFKAARIDALTEIGNRLRLHEDLDGLVARASRYGHRYCAALCDVDWFKYYNDHFGHPAGDDALRRIVKAMEHGLRRGDSIYRYGGEEFIVLLAEQSPSDAAAVMHRLRKNVERLAIAQSPHAPAGAGRNVLTISVGIAELSDVADGPLPQTWLRRADEALYRAKANGRNRIEVDDGRRSEPAAGSVIQ